MIVDQVGIVANPAFNINSGHEVKSKRENKKGFFPCPRSRLRIWSRVTGSAVPPRVSPLILHTQAESDWLVLTHGIPPLSATASVYGYHR